MQGRDPQDRDRDAIGGVETEPEPGSWGDAEAYAPPPRLARGTAVGRFILVEELGSGGMGVVYSAYDPQLDRKVAIKLMRPEVFGPARSDEARARVQREARALAQLSHPNVVAVYDVGALGDDLFLAMELVDGTSLAEWLQARTRSWREIVEAFAAAARGLQAAHDAGLVHRDFKPQNVLVGADGRIKVTDFGLVTGLDAADDFDDAELVELRSLGESDTALALTRTGTVVGTPRYMGPEHYAGRVSDPRADQFSFCLALYEALYGQAAFEAGDYATRKEAVRAGRLQPPPRDSAVPPWIGQALVRGLRVDPQERFPSMLALVDALQRDPRAALRRRATIVAGAVAAIAIGAGVMGVSRSGPTAEACPRPERSLRQVWNDSVEARIQRAFSATGKPYADDTWQRVEHEVEHYLGDWAAMHQQACRATRVDGTQSAELLDLRMACLDERLTEVGALVAELAEADDAMMRRATNAVYRLSPLGECADNQALLSIIRPPTSAATRARVEQTREVVATARALRGAGSFDEGLERATAAVATAREIDYRPLRAEALYTLGNLQIEANREAEALTSLDDAIFEAEACRYDRIAVMALNDLIFTARTRPPEPARLRDWERHARAALTRMGGDAELEGWLESHLGAVAYEHGEFEAAQRAWQRTIELWGSVHPPDHPALGRAYSNLGLAATNRGAIADAAEYQRRALANLEQSLGPDHPVTGDALNNLGEAALAEGDYDGAAQAYERATTVWAGAYGDDNPRVGIGQLNRASLAVRVGRYDDAETLLGGALTLFERTVGSAHSLVAYTETTLSAVARGRGDAEAALRHARRAVEIWTAGAGADSPLVGLAEAAVGDALLAAGQHGRALSSLRRALALLEAGHGPAHYNTSFALHALGETLLASGDLDGALPLLERAVAIRGALPASDLDRARSQFALARALVASKGDRVRSRALAADALAAYERAGPPVRTEHDRLERWLGTLGDGGEAR